MQVEEPRCGFSVTSCRSTSSEGAIDDAEEEAIEDIEQEPVQVQDVICGYSVTSCRSTSSEGAIQGETIEDIQQEPVQVEEAICTWLLCDVMAVLTSQHQISEIYPYPLANLLEHKASANEAFLGYRFSDSSAHSNAVHFKPISCGIPLMLALCWLTSMNKRF